MKKGNRHIGPSFDDFLAEEGILNEVHATALKRVLAWQVKHAMAEQHLSKSAMAEAMQSSRSALDRLLDPDNEAVTLRTLTKAAKVLGKRLRLELV
jgi:antitoxin HicB